MLAIRYRLDVWTSVYIQLKCHVLLVFEIKIRYDSYQIEMVFFKIWFDKT